MSDITAEEAFALAASIRKRITIFGRPSIQAVIVNDIKAPIRRMLEQLSTGSMSCIGFVKLLIWLYKTRNLILNELPEPDFNNTRHPNTHALIRMRDRFFEQLDLPSREKELRAIWKFVIITHAHDTPYRNLFNRVIELWLQEEWVIDDSGEPKKYWRQKEYGSKGTKS